MLEDDLVLITDEHGKVDTIVPVESAGEDIQVFEGILCPGFVNAHCHLELSHMKGCIPEHTGIVDFVLQIVQQRHFPEDEILAAIEKAENDMLSAGIVAVGDICNNTLTLTQKKRNRLHYHNFIEVSGWNPLIAAMRMEKSLEHYYNFKNVFPHQTSLVPHAPYSVSDDLWNLMQPYFSNNILTIHNQESAAENELFKEASGDFIRLYETMQISNPGFKAFGINSLAACFSKMKNGKHVTLVHNNFTSQEDIEVVKQYNTPVTFCLCPNANVYIENVLPPVDLLLQNKLNICIGTDSLASNHQLSIWEEINTLRTHFPHISLSVLLQAATLNGARALGIDDMLGTFEKGKKPGVLLIDNSSLIKRLL